MDDQKKVDHYEVTIPLYVVVDISVAEWAQGKTAFGGIYLPESVIDSLKVAAAEHLTDGLPDLEIVETYAVYDDESIDELDYEGPLYQLKDYDANVRILGVAYGDQETS